MIKELWNKLFKKQLPDDENVINLNSRKQKKKILGDIPKPDKVSDLLTPARDLAKVETQPVMIVGFGCHACGASFLALAPMDLGLGLKDCQTCNAYSVTVQMIFGLISASQEILCPGFDEIEDFGLSSV